MSGTQHCFNVLLDFVITEVTQKALIDCQRDFCKLNSIPSIFTELSPLNHLVIIMYACPYHVLVSTKGIVYDL